MQEPPVPTRGLRPRRRPHFAVRPALPASPGVRCLTWPAPFKVRQRFFLRAAVHLRLDGPPVQVEPAGGFFVISGLGVNQLAITPKQLVGGEAAGMEIGGQTLGCGDVAVTNPAPSPPNRSASSVRGSITARSSRSHPCAESASASPWPGIACRQRRVRRKLRPGRRAETCGEGQPFRCSTPRSRVRRSVARDGNQHGVLDGPRGFHLLDLPASSVTSCSKSGLANA